MLQFTCGRCGTYWPVPVVIPVTVQQFLKVLKNNERCTACYSFDIYLGGLLDLGSEEELDAS